MMTIFQFWLYHDPPIKRIKRQAQVGLSFYFKIAWLGGGCQTARRAALEIPNQLSVTSVDAVLLSTLYP
jgi:hypothetical protein